MGGPVGGARLLKHAEMDRDRVRLVWEFQKGAEYLLADIYNKDPNH